MNIAGNKVTTVLEFEETFQSAFGIPVKVYRSKKRKADPSNKIAEIRDTSKKDSLKFKMSMTVEEFEQSVFNAMGIMTQIVRSDGSFANNDWTLAKVLENLEKRGYSKSSDTLIELDTSDESELDDATSTGETTDIYTIRALDTDEGCSFEWLHEEPIEDFEPVLFSIYAEGDSIVHQTLGKEILSTKLLQFEITEGDSWSGGSKTLTYTIQIELKMTEEFKALVNDKDFMVVPAFRFRKRGEEPVLEEYLTHEMTEDKEVRLGLE